MNTFGFGVKFYLLKRGMVARKQGGDISSFAVNMNSDYIFLFHNRFLLKPLNVLRSSK